MRDTILGFACMSVLGCADPSESFEDFANRYRSDDVAPMPSSDGGLALPGVLPTPEQASGDYLLAISVYLSRSKPIVNLLQVRAAMKGDSLEMMIRYQPLLASDRKTPAGEFGPWSTLVVPPNGKYQGETIRASTPAAANPVTGTDIEAELALGGSFQVDLATGVVEFLCGDVSGMVTSPTKLPLTGSTFTATRITDPANYPPTVINCDKTPAAPLP